MSTTPPEFAASIEPAISWTDGLRRGIWPKPNLFWVAAVYLALYIVRPWEVLFPELGVMHFERFMVVGVLGWTIACRGFMVKLTKQNTSMILLLFAVLLTYINAYDPDKTATELTEFFGITMTYFVITKTVRTPYQLFFLIACYLVATSLYVFKSEWEYFLHSAARWDMGVKRLAGIDYTHGHPNSFGATMLCSLPIAVFFRRVKGTFCQTWPRRMHKLFSYLLVTYIACAVCGIFLTRSRSMTLGIVVFAALIVIRQRNFAGKLRGFLVTALLVCVAILFAPEDIRLRMQTMIDSSVELEHGQKGAGASAAGRWEGWLASVEAFKQYPLTGVGMGSFLAYRVKHIDRVPLNAHNLPGELLGETGIIGTCAFSFFLLVLLFNTRELVRLGKEIREYTGDYIYGLLGIGLLDGIMLLLWIGVSSHNIQMYQWYWFAAFITLAVGFAKRERDRSVANSLEDQESNVVPTFG